MKNIWARLFLAAFLTAGCMLPALAWDDTGHKISAYIAWQRMTPQARDAVIKILRAAPEDSQLGTFYMGYGPQSDEAKKLEYFMLVSTWADIVRDRSFATRYKNYHKGNWHYDDTFWKQVDGKMEALSGFEEGGVGVDKLVEFDKVIRDPAASDRDKAIAIAWIMHIGGDLHQPLHTSARVTDLEPKGDQGGNLFLLTPQGTPRDKQVNLHWFWDSIVGRNVTFKEGMCDDDYLVPIAEKMMKKHSFADAQHRLSLGNYTEWQKESFALNPTDVFSADLVRFETPSEKYRKNAYKIAQAQLALAGYRLGETLNAVFGSAPVTAARAANCSIIRKIMYPIFKKQTPENTVKAKPTAALLNICPSGPAARPTVMVDIAGRKTARTFDVAKVFESEDEARKFAAANAVSDISFDMP